MNRRVQDRLDSLEPGYYLQKDSIIKVVETRNHRKIALRQNERGFFDYEPGLIFRLFPNHKVDENVGT